MQPKGLGRQTRSDDSGARNWGLLREWSPGDAIKQVVYYCPCSLPCQTVCTTLAGQYISRTGHREIRYPPSDNGQTD